MGHPERIAQFKAIETDPTAPQPFAAGGYFGLQQIRWSPTNIADTPAEGLSRLFMLPGAHYSAPEMSWKFESLRVDRLPLKPRARPAVPRRPVRGRCPHLPRVGTSSTST